MLDYPVIRPLSSVTVEDFEYAKTSCLTIHRSYPLWRLIKSNRALRFALLRYCLNLKPLFYGNFEQNSFNFN